MPYFTVRGPLPISASATTLNPSDKSADLTLSGGNLSFSVTAPAGARSIATVATNARIYFELLVDVHNSSLWVGIANSSADLTLFLSGATGSPSTAGVARTFDGQFTDVDSGNNGLGFFTSSQPNSPGDVVGFAFDSSNGKVWMRKNAEDWNASGSAFPDVGSQAGGWTLAITPDGPYYIIAGGNASGDAGTMRFSSASWGFTVPTGFSQLS